MKSWMRFGLVAGVAVALSVTAALAAEVTVGDFVYQIAKARNIAAVDSVSAERGLRAAGVNLPRLDLGKALTEGDVVNIATSVGVPVSTQRPSSPFSQTQVDSFMLTFAVDLNGNGGKPGSKTQGTTRPDPQPGKGKSKGHYKSPSEPI